MVQLKPINRLIFGGLIAAFMLLASCKEPMAPVSIDLKPNARDKAVILSMTCVKENSATYLVYNYAEALGSDDGRGITFGIIGFTSGTYDGTQLLKRIRDLEPNNILVTKYLAAFEAIDASHDDGKTNDMTGLGGFIDDFTIHGNDTKVKQAQLEKLDELYWAPALRVAQKYGVKRLLTLQALYDACVNHGEEGSWPKPGMAALAARTSEQATPPSAGGDEAAWLQKFLDLRWDYMSRDPAWKKSEDRIQMTRKMINEANWNLATPLYIDVNKEHFTVTGMGVY